MSETQIDLIKRGKGSGSDPTKFIRSDGADGYSLATPPGGSVAETTSRIFRSTNQVIPNATYTAVIFDSISYDNGGMINLGAQPTRITVPAGASGRYLVGCGCNFVANATGYRQVLVKVNASIVFALVTQPGNQAAVNPDAEFALSTMYNLVAGDYVEMLVLQTSGGNLNLQFVSGRSPVFWMALIGAATASSLSAYTAIIGDGTTNPWVVTHNLGTTNITVVIRLTSTGEIIEGTVTIVNTNSISINFAFENIPTSNQYTVVILGR